MSKMRKLLAILLTFAMVLGMSISTFAVEAATITVNNAGAAILSYVQVIEPDATTATGWKFSTPAIQKAYTDALHSDPQIAIAMLIKYEYTREGTGKTLPETAPSIIKNAPAATAAQIDTALSNLAKKNVEFDEMNNPQDVLKAGVYAINATETGYTYKTMAAYVGFGALQGEEYPALQNALVIAKKSDMNITKDNNDADDVTMINKEVKYTVVTYVPYIDANETENRTFKITDAISGADYKVAEGKVVGTVTMAGKSVAADIVPDEADSHKFTINLSSLVESVDNPNAGKEIIVEYYAVVKAIDVVNTVSNHISGEIVDSDVEHFYTGSIVLTKTNEDGSEKLANAGFKVYDKADSTKTYLKFTQDVDANGNAIPGQYTYNPNGAEEVFTAEDGTVTIKGLDVGTYHFDEKTAPEGYSINEAGVDVTVKVDKAETTEVEEKVAEANLTAAGSIADTKLVHLPSTGGIGTTMFTIGGCAIMIAAAYLFFTSRKREEA